MSSSQRNKNVCRNFYTIIIIIIATQMAHFYNIRVRYTLVGRRDGATLRLANKTLCATTTAAAIVTQDKRTAAAAVLNGRRRTLTVLLERFTHVAINYGQTGCNNDKQLARQNDPAFYTRVLTKILSSRFI